MLADVPRRIIDHESVTTQEIADELKCSRRTAQDLVIRKTKSGEWEQVFKVVEGAPRPVHSYRLKKKSRK